MAKEVIIALDFGGAAEAFEFLNEFRNLGRKPYVKVGMELFYSAGPDLVRELKNRGFSVFLDLKLHDIPNTVRQAMASLSGLGADMVNLHAAGGSEMMRAALEGLSADTKAARPILIAVTQLTSTSEETLRNELLIGSGMEETVLSYARNALASGLDGVVCSPLESAGIKRVCGGDFLTVTPGVRFAEGSTDDQKRVTTPAQAAENGSDYIVVGRPITKADDPIAVYERCVLEFLGNA